MRRRKREPARITREPATITTSALEDIQRAHDRLDKAGDIVREASWRIDQAFGRIITLERQQRILSALEERLAAVEHALAGYTEAVGRDYLNENWPADRNDADLPVRPCGGRRPHYAHAWGSAGLDDDVRLYCPGYPDDGEPAMPDAVTLAAGDENKRTPPEDNARPTLQQRYWLHELLTFHTHGRGGRVTDFLGPARSGKTWLVRQLAERGYPEPDGPWREWAERWAAKPPTPATWWAMVATPDPDYAQLARGWQETWGST